MRTRKLLRKIAILSVSIGCGWHALAQSQQHHWYDGQVRRPVWIDPALNADFSVQSAAPDRVLSPAAASRKKSVSSSPVFRDAPDGSGGLRALPGGVIVRVNPTMPDEQRQALFLRHALTNPRPLGPGLGLWLIATPPGIAALQMANRLHESGEFVSASPNWWQARSLK